MTCTYVGDVANFLSIILLLTALGFRKHKYVSLSTDPSLAVSADKQYVNISYKVTSVRLHKFRGLGSAIAMGRYS